MIDVVRKLDARLSEAEIGIDKVEERFRTPEFKDVFEEAMLRSGRALSEDRRVYLSNLLANGLTETDFDNAHVKKLLFVLNDLSDPEIILLTCCNLANRSNAQEFYRLHENVLRPVPVVIGSPRELREKSGFRNHGGND